MNCPVDVKEYLKRQMLVQGGDGDYQVASSLNRTITDGGAEVREQIQRRTFGNSGSSGGVLQPPGNEDTYLMFESLGRDFSSPMNAGNISFNIPQINNGNSVTNAVQISINPFYFPQVYNRAGTPEFYFHRRVFMRLLTLPSTASNLAFGGNNYHFEFEVTNTSGIAVLLTPVRDTFYLPRPVQLMTDFNVKFFRPMLGNVPNSTNIPIPSDVITVVGLAGTNPGIFYVLGTDTTDVFSAQEPALPTPSYPRTPPAPGVAVYTTNFNSTLPALNAQMNDPNGLFVTSVESAKFFIIAAIDLTAAVGTPAGNSIWDHPGFPVIPPLPPDNVLSVVPPPGNPGYFIPFNMYLPKNRIAISTRITCSRDVPTNYIVAAHV